MTRLRKSLVVLVSSLGLGLAVAGAYAHSGGMGAGMMQGMESGMGPGMMQGMMSGHGAGMHGGMHGAMAGGMQHDEATHADMGVVHQLLANHERIERTVTNLPDGIKTVTESKDPQVAQAIKAHVASMEKRLTDGRQFSMFSSTLPVLFENKDKIKTTVEMTEKGSVVTQVSGDAKVVAALQAHAVEVNELARDGMVAMMRNARMDMPMMRQSPFGDMGPNRGPAPDSKAR